MSSFTLIRWSGLVAMLGGILLIVAVVAIASRPVGCIATECDLPGRSMRDWDTFAPLFLTAMLLNTIGLAGLAMRARGAGRLGTLGRIGLPMAIIGVGLLAVGGLLQELVFAGNFPLMPVFVIPGLLALVVGVLLVGLAILRAQVLPRWAAALLIVGALALLGFNDQNSRVLLAIPFGVACMTVGYVLWSDRAATQRQHGLRPKL